MSIQVIMPLQTNFTPTFWPKTPQANKFRQIMQDKNSNKKRRHHSESKHNVNSLAMKATPSTPSSSLNKPLQHSLSSPFYAGAKFSEAPLPSFLPKPPTHWIDSTDLCDLNKLSTLNDELSNLINNAQVIEETISIHLEKTTVTETESGKPNNQTTSPSSKYYAVDAISGNGNRKSRSDSVTYNFRNTRRNTPQCQTKCKNTRYSSFSRQNIHQKIAAVV